MSRPEHTAPPEIFYNEEEARKYITSSRMLEIQHTMSERALELLALPPDRPSLLLDLGCGSGLSGEVLSEEGHHWVGLDISQAMLDVANEREVDGDLSLHDLGQGLPFRPGMFDGAISVSAIQWLCNADKATHNPRRRIAAFFQSLYNCLARGARAALQFYPENPQQVEMLTEAAMRCGFTGGLVVDFPNSTKAKKYFLCLIAGQCDPSQMPRGLTGDPDNPDTVPVGKRERHERSRPGKRASVKSRDWILDKKDRQRRQGRDVRPDTKYTGRRRMNARGF